MRTKENKKTATILNWSRGGGEVAKALGMPWGMSLLALSQPAVVTATAVVTEETTFPQPAGLTLRVNTLQIP